MSDSFCTTRYSRVLLGISLALGIVVGCLALFGCQPSGPSAHFSPTAEASPLLAAAPMIGPSGTEPAKLERKEPVAQPAPEQEKKPWIGLAPAPELTARGLALILEAEVGGRHQYEKWPHPEWEHDQYSGVTWGIGYDGHQNSKANIVGDWTRLGPRNAQRLAETQPYYGSAAGPACEKVKDILVPWADGVEVFRAVDMARVESQCKRAFPGFESVRAGCKDALRSLVFNRGAAMTGAARTEMRAIRGLVAEEKRDYEAIAEEFRKMTRVWVGKPIYAGMKARRYAEAELVMQN